MSAKLSAKEKENKLIEIAKLKGSVISENTSLSDLFRLVDEDLSHIGNGILGGRDVEEDLEEILYLSFSDYAEEYALAPAIEKVWGVEIEPIIEEDLEEILFGMDCWRVEWDYIFETYAVKQDKLYTFESSTNKLCFKNQSDAEAVAKAMNRFMEEGC